MIIKNDNLLIHCHSTVPQYRLAIALSTQMPVKKYVKCHDWPTYDLLIYAHEPFILFY